MPSIKRKGGVHTLYTETGGPKCRLALRMKKMIHGGQSGKKSGKSFQNYGKK